MLTAQDKPDTGELRIGRKVKNMAYVAQSRNAVNVTATAWEEISAKQYIITIGKYRPQSRGYIIRFDFSSFDQQKHVDDLFAGKHNGLHLVKLSKSGGNLSLLDEPTNAFDVETLRTLEGVLPAFPGCDLVISFVRWFLDLIAIPILAIEGNSKVKWFQVSLRDYEEDNKAAPRAKGAGPPPHLLGVHPRLMQPAVPHFGTES